MSATSAAVATSGAGRPSASQTPPSPHVIETGEELDALERSRLERWGGVDPGDVSSVLTTTGGKLDGFGGLSYDDETLTFTVYIAADAPNPEATRQTMTDDFRAASAGSHMLLTFKTTDATEETLRALARELADPQTWPEPLRKDIERRPTISVHMDEQKVIVYSFDADGAKQRFVEEQFPGLVRVDNTEFVPAVENRRADSPANGWNGAQAMCDNQDPNDSCAAGFAGNGELALCTAGFTYIRAGVRYMATARHCLANNSNWYRYEPYRYTIGVNTVYGTDNTLDVSLIRQSTYGYRNWFWIGGRYGADDREITGTELTAPLIPNSPCQWSKQRLANW